MLQSDRCKKTCNHVVACLQKIEYGHSHGFCKLACAEIACQWNQGTCKEVEPRQITDLVVHKKFRCSSLDNDGIQEDTRMKNLNKFDPRIVMDRKLNAGHISELIRNVQLVDEHVALFKSIESRSLTNENNFSNLFVESIPNNLLRKHKKCSESKHIVLFWRKWKFLEKLLALLKDLLKVN